MLHQLRSQAEKARSLVVVAVRLQLSHGKEVLLLLEEELSLNLLDLSWAKLGEPDPADAADTKAVQATEALRYRPGDRRRRRAGIQGGILTEVTANGGILQGIATQVWILERGGVGEAGGRREGRRGKSGSERRI